MPTLAKSFRTRPAGLLGSRPFDRSSMTASSGAALRLLALAIVLAALYALGALLPFWYLASPEAGVAFFPPAGLTLSFLVLSPRRTWPLWLATVGATEVIVDVTNGQSLRLALGFGAANVLGPYVGAIGIKTTWAAGRTRKLRELLAVYLLYGAAVGPAVGALIASTSAVLIDGASDGPSIFGRWWLGDAIGVIVLATPILAWSRRGRSEVSCGLLEVGITSLLATAITIVPAVLWHYPIIYAVLPVLMWAAIRGGWRAVSVAGVGVAFAADWATVTGRANALFATGTTNEQLAYVQLFLAVTLLAALTLSVEVGDRLQAERKVSEVERTVATAADEERRRIVRETHDIVGHALNVMLSQAGAARRVLATDQGLSRDFLESIENVGRTAFGELDVALGLADVPPDLSPLRGLVGVPDLVEVLRQTGMNVELDILGARNAEISTLVDWSAYRIVQEALTNVVKHAPNARARVVISFERDAVVVSVTDEGLPTRSRPDNGGRGLIGMRERVTVLGGQIELGPTEEGGFSVWARLPSSPR